MATIYLYHFSERLHHARHYIGSVEEDGHLAYRHAQHRSGNGAKVCRAAVDNGAELQLVRTWVVPARWVRRLERMMKGQKRAPDLCPFCNPKHWQSNAADLMKWIPKVQDAVSHETVKGNQQ